VPLDLAQLVIEQLFADCLETGGVSAGEPAARAANAVSSAEETNVTDRPMTREIVRAKNG